MNTTCPKTWHAELYLDSLGCALVIAVSAAIIVLFTTLDFVDESSARRHTARACEPGHAAVADYPDQRPGAPHSAEPAVCA